MKSLKKNYLYSLTYQILILFVPLITIPYISRVLGADQIGIYSYTYSIVYYFMLFAMLGINNYGNREIAKHREDTIETSRLFFSIYSLQLISSTIMSLLYILYVVFLSGGSQYIALIQSICMLSVFFDYNWFFFGHEEFKLTVVRNIIIKLSTLIAIFTFVKGPSDLPIYTLISALSILCSQLALIPFLKNRVHLIKPTFTDIKRHIKPCLILFIPVISTGLYTIMDKTMLGLLSDMTEVGYYSQAEKIISFPIAIITALSAVMMPRISNLVAKQNFQKIYEYINKTIHFTSFLVMPMAFGLAIIAISFTPIFLGDGFEKSIPIIMLLSIIIIFKAIGSILRVQYMTPHNMDKEYVVTTIIGAIVNLIANLTFIPHLQSIGACIGTILAELAVVAYMSYVLRNKLPIIRYTKIILAYFWKALIMFIIVFPINFITTFNNYVKIIIEIMSSTLIYGLLNYHTIINIIRRKILWISK